MKLIHLVPQVHKKSDGVGKFVRELSAEMSSKGNDCIVVTVETNHPTMNGFTHQNFSQTFGFPEKFGFSFALVIFLWRIIKNNQSVILHIHGLWMWQNIIPLFLPKCSYVYSPHGSISNYTFSQLGFWKKIYWHTIQKRVLKNASALHVTSTLEREWLIQNGFNHNNILVLRLGMLMPSVDVVDTPMRDQIKFIFIGRLVAIKNLDLFIQVFDEFVTSYNLAWTFDIVGSFDAEFGNALVQKYRHLDFVRFRGELSADEIHESLHDVDIITLPSYSENFSFAVLEGLVFGCKVLCTSGTPWADLLPAQFVFTFEASSKLSLEQQFLEIKNHWSKGEIDEKTKVSLLTTNTFCIRTLSGHYMEMYLNVLSKLPC